jgi:hypothetical protein
METVKASGHVTKEQISFYMGATDGDNYVDVGAYTAASIKDSSTSEIAWFDQTQGSFYWEFKAVQAIQFGFGKWTSTGLTAAY